MDALTRAKRIAITLARHGFVVLSVIAGNRNARIIIKQPTPNAPIALDAAEIKYSRSADGEETTMAASVEGVQIEWVIRRTS
ncbi:hypothetical protein [Nitrosospira lacus]|nr:hypothetical protein [Nitrosospira lacus]